LRTSILHSALESLSCFRDEETFHHQRRKLVMQKWDKKQIRSVFSVPLTLDIKVTVEIHTHQHFLYFC
jgi:hypothetical protein